MKKYYCLSLLILTFFSAESYADSITTFAITSAQIYVSAWGWGGANSMEFGFTGPNVLIGGSGTAGGPPGSGLPPGLVINSAIQMTFNYWTGTIGSQTYSEWYLGTGLTLTGPSFVLPPGGNSSMVSITVPVMFSGSFNPCEAQEEGGCTGPYFPLNLELNSPGRATFTYQFFPENGIYYLHDAKYVTTPEPGTLFLFGTGLLTVWGGFRARMRLNKARRPNADGI